MPTDITSITSEEDPPIRVLLIRNLSRSIIQIGIGPPVVDLSVIAQSEQFFEFFNSSGVVNILPGQSISIEEDRLNLGQVQNYLDKNLISSTLLLVDIN